MNLTIVPKTVFIVEAEEALSHSLKILLESHERAVRIYKKREEFWNDSAHTDDDIVLLNFERQSANGFKSLNRLLSAARRPHIVITSPHDSAFKSGDRFKGGRVTLLMHPVTPQQLFNAIDRL